MKKSDKGFTLIEMVVALGLFTTILFLMLPLVESSYQVTINQQENSHLEWQLFLIQLEREMETNEFIGIKDEKLLFKEQDKLIKPFTKIEKYNNMVRKVKNDGHHPLLLKVENFHVTEEKGEVKIEVIFLDGNEKAATMYFEKK